ncbi:14415_t:CDS:2, partial [Cetraspora pellucida]
EIHPLTEDEKINIKYCQEKTCKFLFPYSLVEQETRANIHIRLYTQLTRTLNRILVLPNVGNSKIRACSLYPFDFYYDLKAFQEDYPDIRFITQNEFFEWTKERKIQPIAQHSSMIQDGLNKSFSSKQSMTMRVNESDKFGSKRKKKTYREAMLKLVTNTLKIPSITGEYEAIMILDTSPAEIFPNIPKVIPYSPYIIEESKKILNKLMPYIAVHWRMERGQSELMPKCANELVKTLKKVQNQYGIKNVYLATDFPLNGGNPQSLTFHNISSFHKKAIEILGLDGRFINSSDYIKFDTWISMDAFSQIRNDPKYETEFKGAGIHGILDKIVCINAKYFLRSPKGCGRISSTFTKAISIERQKLKDQHDLINI